MIRRKRRYERVTLDNRKAKLIEKPATVAKAAPRANLRFESINIREKKKKKPTQGRLSQAR